MAKLISKTYGEALFELAVEENQLDVLLEEIQAVTVALKENPELDKLMNHPKINKDEKIKVMEEVFKGKIGDELMGFLNLVLQKERYKNLYEIFNYFIEKVKEVKKIGTAYVTTALPLREEQKKQIEDKLLQTTRYETMEMNFSVDSDLIGGMVIRMKDRVVDSSIKSKLLELQKNLYKIQLG